MALRFVGFIIFILLLWFFLTQIVLPLFQARPLFPWFRGKDEGVQALEKEVNDLQQQVAVLEDATELAAARKKLVRAKAKLEAASGITVPPAQESKSE